MALNKNDGTVKIGTELDSSGLEGGMKQAEKKISGSSEVAAKAIGGITAAAAAAGSALMAIGSFAIDVGGDFSAAMSQVEAISGANSREMSSLTQKAEEMGATTKFSATEAANAMTYMAMAGWDSSSMLDGLGGIMNLAAASGSDLATTSDIVTDALTAFGLKASDSGHFADILAAASSNANTNVNMMGETFKYAAPVAGALGYSAEDCAVAIGLMANAGIKSSQAGTAMRSWLSRMAKPTKESQTAMDALGLSMTNADGSMKSLGQITEDLRTAFSGLTENEQASYAAMLGGQEAMSGILAIANADDSDYFKLTGAISDCDGAAESMSTIMQDNLPGDITIAKSALEGFGIATYKHISTPLRNTVKIATGKIDELKNRMDKGDLAESAEKIGGAIETIGEGIVNFAGDAVAALITTAGWVIDHKLEISIAIGAVGAAWLAYEGFVNGAATAQGLLNSAMNLNPVGLIIAGVAAAGAAFFIYNKSVNKNSKAYEESSKKIGELKSDIETFKGTLETHKDDFKKTKDEINGNADAAGEMADKLFALAGQSKKTAADETRLKMMCEQLNTLVPDLNIAYDNQTGALNRTRKEVDELTNSYKKQAIAQAYQEQMKLLASDYMEAVRNQVVAQDTLNGLHKEGANVVFLYKNKYRELFDLYAKEYRITNTATANQEDLNAIREQAATSATSYIYSLGNLVVAEGTANEMTGGEFIEVWLEASEAVDEANTAVSDAETALDSMTEEMEKAYEQYGINTEATEESAEAMEGLGEAAEGAANKIGPLQKAFSDFAARTGWDVETISETFDALSEKYTEVYNSAFESITGQLGLFDKFNAGEAYTAEELLENLQSQITGMTEWSNNMEILAKAGIDDGLLKQLRDAGPQASAQVKVIADQVLAGNTQFINDLNTSYRTKMTIADSIATEIAETETGFLTFSSKMGIRFNTLINTMSEKGTSAASALGMAARGMYNQLLNAGVYMSDGLINGVVGRLSSRYGEVSSAVGRINTVARHVMAVYSPSKVTMETGEYIGEGFVLGTVNKIEEGISDVRGAISDYADNGIIDYAEKVASMQQFTSSLPGYHAAGEAETTAYHGGWEMIDYDRLSEAIARRFADIQVAIDGQKVGYLTAGYVNEAIGDIAMQEGRGVI